MSAPTTSVVVLPKRRKPITLNIRVTPTQRLVSIYNLSLERKVEDLKTLASEKAKLPRDRLELLWCGNILDDDSTLKACGIVPGVNIIVLKKVAKEPPRAVPSMSESDIHALVVAFRTLTLNPSYKNALQKLSRPDILENIITITPGLSQDPIAISLIQDPELLVRMGDIDTVRRIVSSHPALAEAANHIAAAAHEEAISSANNSSLPSTSSGYSNIVEVLSDDDDMESSQSSDSLPQSTNTTTTPHITAAQVAAALSSASAAQGGSSSAPTSEVTTPSGGGITQEMFYEAIRNAMATVSATTPTAPSPSVTTTAQLPPLEEVSDVEVEEFMDTENASAAAPAASTATATPAAAAAATAAVTAAPASSGGDTDGNLMEQMQQMRELGLLDDALNLQALQIANGNIHVAVDLVFSASITENQ